MLFAASLTALFNVPAVTNPLLNVLLVLLYIGVAVTVPVVESIMVSTGWNVESTLRCSSKPTAIRVVPETAVAMARKCSEAMSGSDNSGPRQKGDSMDSSAVRSQRGVAAKCVVWIRVGSMQAGTVSDAWMLNSSGVSAGRFPMAHGSESASIMLSP